MTEAGKIAGPDPRTLYAVFGRFFIYVSGCMCSFGLALCAVLESVVPLQWIVAGFSGQSM